MPDHLLESLIKGKEWQWFFSGIGVTILSIIAGILRYFKKHKVTLSLFYEDGQLFLLNAGDVAIEAYGMSFDLYDITAKPDLARIKQFFKHLQFPILSGEKKSLLKVTDEFDKSIYEFVENDNDIFKKHYPDSAFPITLGIRIYFSYNVIGKPVLKRKDFELMISGYYGHGVGIGVSTYHYDKQAPFHIKAKKMLPECGKFICHPIRYVKFKNEMKLAQAKLDFDGIIRALIYKQITETEAQTRIERLPKKLSNKQKLEFEKFISHSYAPQVSSQPFNNQTGDNTMDEFEYEGSKFNLNDDGSAEVQVQTSTVITMDKDGNMHINLNNIKSIGIENITDLKTHRVFREGNMTMHQIEFYDGGSAKIGYTSTGQLVEFSTTRMSFSISKDNEIVLKKYEGKAGQHE